VSPRRGFPLSPMEQMTRATKQAILGASQSAPSNTALTHPGPHTLRTFTLIAPAPHQQPRPEAQVVKAAEREEREERAAATARVAAGWAVAAAARAAAATAAAATTVSRAAEEAETVVDEVDELAEAEVNLRVAASQGDMAALAIAEQARALTHYYYSPSPSSLRAAPLR
jgi:hypothetical protein